MAAIEVQVSMRTRGPWFDARRDRIIHAAMRDAEDAVGREAYNRVQVRLRQVLRHPTGYYQSRIVTERRDGGVVVDGGPGRVIYGPWLEGVGSRNFPVTRFRGYFTFRTVAQQLRADAAGIAERAMAPRLRELQ
jgi:hypothetical protein